MAPSAIICAPATTTVSPCGRVFHWPSACLQASTVTSNSCRVRGLGQLTALTTCLEVMDWRRFHNRKQVGSYIGCAPSEHSTGPGQLLGGIDRQGNRRLRSLLTEAVWRLLRWEPCWQGFAKWGAVLRETHGSSVRKKKAIIACVRLLFIDLWRLFTGRATLAGLGFTGPPAAAAPDPEPAHTHPDPHLTQPHLTQPHLTQPHLTQPHLTQPHLTHT